MAKGTSLKNKETKNKPWNTRKNVVSKAMGKQNWLPFMSFLIMFDTRSKNSNTV